MHKNTPPSKVGCASFRRVDHTQVQRAGRGVLQGFEQDHRITMPHTILLLQPTRGHETRTFTDYETEQECFEGICKIYEEYLRQMNPHTPSITYDISELFKFVDNIYDMSCLVHQVSSNTYVPHNKEWLKHQIYSMLKKQANR